MMQPRLYNQNGSFSKVLNQIKVSLTLNMEPLSSAVMYLPRGENIPMRSMVELFSPYGSVGMFRSRTPQDAYGDATTTVELEHMACELADYLVKENISEMMAASTAATRIFSHYGGKRWKLGSVSALGSGNVSVSVNYDNVLTGLLSILEQKPDCMMDFDFTTTPWTVKIIKKPTAVGAECRISRNIADARITYDDSEMCNRVYYDRREKEKDGSWKKDANGDPVIVWYVLDATAEQQKYGLIERTVDVASDLTDEEAKIVAQTFLDEHKNPRVGVQINGIYLADITGESLDKFIVGKLLRLNIPEDGIRVEKHIRSMSWDDVYARPRDVIVMIGDEEDTVVSFLHNLDNSGKGSRGGGGGGGGKNKEKEEKDYYKQYETWFNKTDELITMGAKETARNGEILKQAGMDLDRNGVLIYASNSSTNLQSKLNVESNRISLVVEGTGPNAKVNAASIVAGINKQTGSFVRIAAKTINLDGYVKATDITTDFLRAKIAGISLMSVQAISLSGGLSSAGGDIRTGGTVGGADVLVGGQSLKNAFISASVSNNSLTLTNAAGNSVTFNKAVTVERGWANGTYSVTPTAGVISPADVSTSLNNEGSSRAYLSGSVICIPVDSNLGYTGKEVYLSGGTLSNATGGLHRYGTTTMYIKLGDTYSSAGSHTWYYKDTNSALQSYTYVNLPS